MHLTHTCTVFSVTAPLHRPIVYPEMNSLALKLALKETLVSICLIILCKLFTVQWSEYHGQCMGQQSSKSHVPYSFLELLWIEIIGKTEGHFNFWLSLLLSKTLSWMLKSGLWPKFDLTLDLDFRWVKANKKAQLTLSNPIRRVSFHFTEFHFPRISKFRPRPI